MSKRTGAIYVLTLRLGVVPESGNQTLVWLDDIREEADESEVVLSGRGLVDPL